MAGLHYALRVGYPGGPCGTPHHKCDLALNAPFPLQSWGMLADPWFCWGKRVGGRKLLKAIGEGRRGTVTRGGHHTGHQNTATMTGLLE